MANNPGDVRIEAFDDTATFTIVNGAVAVGLINLGVTDVTVQYAGPRGDENVILLPNIPWNPPQMPGGTYGAFTVLAAGKRVVGTAFYNS